MLYAADLFFSGLIRTLTAARSCAFFYFNLNPSSHYFSRMLAHAAKISNSRQSYYFRI
jgi:hypothetical protein